MTSPYHSPRTLALLSALVFMGAAPLARAEENQMREATITVSAEGQSATAPDMAVLNLAVVSQAKTAREALDANNKKMNDVLAALKKSAIAERDLQTSGFSIQPQYNYPQNPDGQALPPELVAYQITNSLTVRVRDLNNLGAIIDQSVTLGVNQGGDIQFTNDKPDATLEEARKDAVNKAMKKAQALTQAAGVSLGRIVEISETVNNPSMPVYRMAAPTMAKEASVPIQGGENTYNVMVNMTFALKQE